MAWFQGMIDDPSKFRAIAPDAKRIINSLLEMEKPIVCRLNGAAAGLGASIALLCDVIVADEEAKIGTHTSKSDSLPATAVLLFGLN